MQWLNFFGENPGGNSVKPVLEQSVEDSILLNFCNKLQI
jgi:hypothetical protein